MIVSVKWATDSAFTQNVSGGNQTCPAANVNCWTSLRPNHTWEGRYYWKLELAGAPEPVSRATWMFTAMEPPPQVDRVRPYVRTFARSAQRGKRALFFAKVRDNQGQVRMLAVLIY